MPRQANKSKASLIADTELAYTNALTDPEILAKLAVNGFGAEQIAAEKEKLTVVKAAQATQTQKQGLQSTATERTNAAFEDAQAAYQELATAARAAFRDNKPALKTLGIDGPMERTLDAFLTQADTALTNALAADGAIATGLARFGFDMARLKGLHERVWAAATAHAAQERAKGAAMQATADLDVALELLADGFADFKAAAKLALKGDRPAQEKLGIAPVVKKTKDPE